MAEGRRYAQNDLLELAAWQAAQMLQPYVDKGKTLTGYDLLGREPKVSEEEKAAIQEEREAKRQLYRRIETAKIARSEVVGSFGGGK